MAVRTLTDHAFEPDDRVAIIGTDVRATVIKRRPTTCIGCGKPVYLLCDDAYDDRFDCCEPTMLRLNLN